MRLTRKCVKELLSERLVIVYAEPDPADMVHSRAVIAMLTHLDDQAELNEMIVKDIGPVDIVLHLAAGSHVDRSIEYPLEFVQDNTVGTVNMLEYARKHLPNLERFVYFSTDEIFGVAPPGVSYKEYDRYNSTNPYSASKAAAEEFCVAYENTYKMPIVVTHTMNVFGERQHPEKFIPMCIQRARDGEKSHKLGKSPKSRVTVGGHRIKGRKYGGPLPDWS
jgi:dTDP-D-glucose 4,6-dehydratase